MKDIIKVYLWPEFAGVDKGDGGVRRVVEAQRRHLPAQGVEIVDSLEAADLVAIHIFAPDNLLVKCQDKPLVLHNHGCYWSEYLWPNWCYKANAGCMKSIRQADAVTAPSEWVAQALRRHSLRPVSVIGHGIDFDKWTPAKKPMDFVLWNKTRVDPVCDPEPLNELAKLASDVQFLSTFGDDSLPNITLTGLLAYEAARKAVRDAAVYLCTSRETFGIGTIEAMAAGVPILGWAWGGQMEIVEQGETGWLALPGDYDGLLEGLRYCLANRKRLGVRAREVAEERYQWKYVVEEYASLYRRVLDEWEAKEQNPVKVSVVIPAYNLARYLPAALESVRAQSLLAWECLIVDDASPDECGKIADDYAKGDSRFRVIHNKENQYLAGALNTGIGASRGDYVVPLDADNKLPPDALELLADALDRDRSLHIAYGNVRFVGENGETPTVYRGHNTDPGHSGWPMSFRSDWQLIRRAGDGRPANLVPSTSMFRRAVWELTGGYRRRWRTAEDADFWTRATSYGFRADMVTQKDTLIYRNREGSMSRDEQWQDWTKWLPWCRGVSLPPAAVDTGKQAPVSSHDPPQIAVVIPVGPEHRELYIDAVDSVDAQEFRRWECIIVNDSGKPLRWIPSWATIIDTGGKKGVAVARNLGIMASKASLFVPLDADDTLEPSALGRMLEVQQESGGYVYPDFFQIWAAKEMDIWRCPDYDPMLMLDKGCLHAVTGLYRNEDWRRVWGFDPGLPAWEDWDFELKLANIGVCGTRIPEPLFSYRKNTGFRREENYKNWETGKEGILTRWKDYFERRKTLMACGGCPGGGGGRASAVSVARRQTVPPPPNEIEDYVIVEYVGLNEGAMTFRGPSGQIYRFSALQSERQKYVRRGQDADYFGTLTDFQVRELEPKKEEVVVVG